MSSIVLMYIWILVKSYLELGLILACLFTIITIRNGTIDRYWVRDFLFTVFLHPIVIHHLAKEMKKWNKN